MEAPDGRSDAGLTARSDAADAEHAGAATDRRNTTPDLFGRGLLYVMVWSLQIVASTVVSPVLAYVMGPAEFGRLAAAIALYQVLLVLAVLGLDQAVVLERAEDSSSASARGLLMVGMLLSAASTTTLAVTAPLWSGPLGFGGVTPLVVATILWTAPGAVVQLTLALLLTEDRFTAFAVVSALSAVGGQIFGIGFLFLGDRQADTYAWGGVMSQFAAMAVGVILARPRAGGLLEWGRARRAVLLGFPVMLGGLSTFLMNAGDRIVVQRLLGPVEVGRYQVAYTVGYVVILLLSFTSQAWLPRLAAVRGEAERLRLIAASRDQLVGLLLPVVLGMTLGAPIVLRVVAPPSFRPDSLLVVVCLVALCAFPVAASGATSRALLTARRPRPIAVVTFIAAVLNLALTLLLVPWLGIAGAAVATLIAFHSQDLLQRLALGAGAAWPKTPRRLFLAVLAVTAVCAVSVLLPQSLVWNVTRFAAAVACVPWFFLRLRAAGQPDRQSAGSRGATYSAITLRPSR